MFSLRCLYTSTQYPPSDSQLCVQVLRFIGSNFPSCTGRRDLSYLGVNCAAALAMTSFWPSYTMTRYPTTKQPPPPERLSIPLVESD